jgi:hypothetical protein
VRSFILRLSWERRTLAAPSFIAASTGTTDTGGAWSHTTAAPGAAGRLIIVHVLQDGNAAGGVAVSISSATNVTNLAGAANSFTSLGSFFVGPVLTPTAYHYLFMGRSTGTSAIVITGANSQTDDIYIRAYEFSNVSTGTTADLVYENASAGSLALGGATSGTIADVSVQTLGPDRLALNFIAINDDNAQAAFTGETGGDWTEAVAEYADSGGTDGSIGLQIAYGYTLEYLAGFTGGSPAIFGHNTTAQLQAQSFVAPSTGSSWRVAAVIAASASPTDDVSIEIRSDSSGQPSGTVLGSGTVDVTNNAARYYSVPITASLTSGTTYWIVYTRTGATDNTNNYATYPSTLAYGSGQGASYDGSTWTTGLTDRTFGIIAGDGSTTIDGGTTTNSDATDSWGVIGLALIGTTVVSSPRHGFVNFQNPGVFCKAHQAIRRWRFGEHGIIVPDGIAFA